jgi:hypothetical protein
MLYFKIAPFRVRGNYSSLTKPLTLKGALLHGFMHLQSIEIKVTEMFEIFLPKQKIATF